MTTQRRINMRNINFIQTSQQCFYFVECSTAEMGDTIVAYKDNTPVGYREWNGQHTDIPTMGVDSLIQDTMNYMMVGDIPSFKLIKKSGRSIDLNGQVPPWGPTQIHHITLY